MAPLPQGPEAASLAKDWPPFLGGAAPRVGVVGDLDAPTSSGVLWQASPSQFRLEVPDVARYGVSGGRDVVVQPEPGAALADVVRFLRVTPLAALLYQRGILALHASAAARDDRVVVLAGDSGSGKSTLLAVLLQRGFSIVSDELTIVDRDAAGRPVVVPTFPELTLWPDVLQRLGFDLAPGREPGPRVLEHRARRAVSALPLATIYWLTVHNRSRVESEELAGAARFSAPGTLACNTQVAHALLDPVRYYESAAAVSRAAAMIRLRRPRGQWSGDALADEVERRWT